LRCDQSSADGKNAWQQQGGRIAIELATKLRNLHAGSNVRTQLRIL